MRLNLQHDGLDDDELMIDTATHYFVTSVPKVKLAGRADGQTRGLQTDHSSGGEPGRLGNESPEKRSDEV
jgi:hypothetical protein